MVEQKEALISKLDKLDFRYEELTTKINDPEIAADPNKLIPLTKEQGKLRSMVERYREYKQSLEGLDEAEQMLEDPDTDQEYRELAQEEKQRLEQKQENLLKEIQDELVMGEDEAVNSIIMEIRAGAGGDEAALFARDLYNMYAKYAETKGWKTEPITFAAGQMGGFKEAIFSIKGKGAWADLAFESGGHRVQRVPETESQGRVHTSAATVVVMPEPEEVDIEISPNDVLEHVSRASGPGGQSVNKTNSAIKLEHVPTGITVSMRDEKSQHKNRAKAWRILRSRIYEHFESQKRAQRDSQRKSLVGSGDRSSKIRTYNFPQSRITDHRINLTVYSLEKVMAGHLEEIVQALKDHERQERLKNL